MKKTESMNTEEKIDAILKYQRGAYRWAVPRGLMSLIFFLVFIVLPVSAVIYGLDWLQEHQKELQVKMEMLVKKQIQEIPAMLLRQYRP